MIRFSQRVSNVLFRSPRKLKAARKMALLATTDGHSSAVEKFVFGLTSRNLLPQDTKLICARCRAGATLQYLVFLGEEADVLKHLNKVTKLRTTSATVAQLADKFWRLHNNVAAYNKQAFRKDPAPALRFEYLQDLLSVYTDEFGFVHRIATEVVGYIEDRQWSDTAKQEAWNLFLAQDTHET